MGCNAEYTEVVLPRPIFGFKLEFLSVSWVINHMTCYNLSALIGGKFI